MRPPKNAKYSSRKPMPLRAAFACQMVGAVWVTLLAASFLIVSGCAERPPQYQVIPAILDGDARKLEVLLLDTENVDVNWRAGGGGLTALHSAAYQNNVEIVKLLLRHGADPNIANRDGYTPLNAAAYSGHVEVVRLLLLADAKTDVHEHRYGNTPLTAAARKGHTDVVQVLLEHGADRDARSAAGLSPADWALRFGHKDVVELLTSYWPSNIHNSDAGDRVDPEASGSPPEAGRPQ